MSAREGRCRGAGLFTVTLGLSLLRHGDSKQRPSKRETGLAPAIGEQPVVPDAMESRGQQMQQASKKNLSVVMVALIVTGPVPASTSCS